MISASNQQMMSQKSTVKTVYVVHPFMLIYPRRVESKRTFVIDLRSNEAPLIVEIPILVWALTALPSEFSREEAVAVWSGEPGASEYIDEIWDFAVAEGLLLSKDAAQPLIERTKLWNQIGWENAATYHEATRDYPFVDMSHKNAFKSDNKRMKEYEEDGIAPPVFVKFPALESVQLSKITPEFDTYLQNRKMPNSARDRQKDLSLLFDFCFGQRLKLEREFDERNFLQLESLRKTIPSGGGRHPTEVFVAVIDQKFGLREGLYHYNVQFNSLDLLAEISLPDLNAVADLPADTEAVLFFASFSERAMWRYRDPRSWRAFVIDVGHIETMCGVVCKALNYSLELCHGFNNIEAAELLNLDNMRTPVMSMAAIRSMDGTVHRRSEGTVAQQGAHEAPLPGQKANHSRILNQSQIANQSQISNQSQVSNPMGLLQTSSLLFMRSTDGTLVDGRHCQQSLSLDDIELLSFFAEPSSLEQGKEAGFDEDRIENAKSLGYLVDCNKDEIPHAGIWETYNLQRAACLMYETIGGGTRRNSFYPPVQNTLGLTDNFSALLNRRTERFFSNKAVSSETFSQVLEEMRQALEPYPWLSLRIVAQGVEGLDASVYSQDRETGKLTKTVETYTRKELLECAHGQWWLNGGGFCCFFVVSLEELARQNKAGIFPSNYFEMLLLLGEAGQALLNVATASGLGSWMTPAVSETIAAKILALNGSEEALYFFKIGIPDEGTKDSSDKRSPLEH